jgi:uncharacterized protein (DUF302 family)
MDYSFNKIINGISFEEAVNHVVEILRTEGFGIITEIDVQKTFKEKINVDFKKYRILGACNPHFAYKTLQVEDKIGVFLPCNVVIQEHENGAIEVLAIDPVAAMSSVENSALELLALEIRDKLKSAIDKL